MHGLLKNISAGASSKLGGQTPFCPKNYFVPSVFCPKKGNFCPILPDFQNFENSCDYAKEFFRRPWVTKRN